MADSARPVLGVLVSGLSLKGEGPFGIITSFCREVVQAANAREGTAFIFTLDQIPADDDTVTGWTYENDEWKTYTYALPVCVYNRIGSRKTEQKKSTHKKIEWLKDKGIYFFNEKFLDKWQIHRTLQYTEISSMCPETKLYKETSYLKQFLEKHLFIYLKPIHGSLGRGIIRLLRTGQTYTCQYTTGKGAITYHYSSFDKMARMLQKKIGMRSYIMQQGLHLIKHQDALIDFRALVQKNHNGVWSITSIVGRSGPQKSIVSNVARGGRLMGLTESLALSDATNVPRETLKENIRQIALQVARTFEQFAPGHYAELGIDLGIDCYGKVWLIEINSKPSKGDTSLASIHSGPRRSVIRLVDYSLYRSGIRRSRSSNSRSSKRRSS
ncbi:YheC/YheD family protein [Aneurinibacillus terranovensis]|uniref:YheC/YheD family endospore coat-associated protein n=1 Tax=Aneurinibacillus terranovensis TaxID=278991 RepID=UPI0004187FA5|nr:YheC/YheD family protein [Aneurinibacillus terranovensis]